MKIKYVLLACIFFISMIFLVIASQIESQVQIHKGWNLIHGFANPDQLTGSLDKSSIKAIWAFIPTTQEYVQVYPNPDNEKIDLLGDDYLIKTSFWVYSSKESSVELNGVLNAVKYSVEEPLPLKEHQLYKGWNFLAYLPEMQDKSLDELKGDCNIEKAYLWKFDDRSDDKGWVKMPMNGKFVGNEMLMMGFIAKVSKNCKFSGSENNLIPPIIPDIGSQSNTNLQKDISDYKYIGTSKLNEDCDEIPISETQKIGMSKPINICLDLIKIEYDNINTGENIYVYLVNIDGDIENYKNYLDKNIKFDSSGFVVSNINNRLFWFIKDTVNYVQVEYTTIDPIEGFSYYKKPDINNPVVKLYLEKYPK